MIEGSPNAASGPEQGGRGGARSPRGGFSLPFGRSGPPRPTLTVLLGALLAYLVLAATCARAVGLVGEVAIGWALPAPPHVLVQLSPPLDTDPGEGALRATLTRPTERLQLGPIGVPLTVNAYTGGLADWPARAARALTGSWEAGVGMHVLLGGLLLVLVHRFLLFHGTRIAAGAAAWLLATDWCFVFYRKVLGGTEILLQAAALLVLWALWSRRWKGGVHGTVAIAVGVGLGLAAKATFAATLAGFGLAALLTRWDHPALKPPARVHPGVLLGIPFLFVSPLLVAAVHHAALTGPTVVSHDTLGLQVARLWQSGSTRGPAREGASNLLYFFGNPLAFFASAYGAVAVPPVSVLRLLGFAAALSGIGIEWRAPARNAAGALLRFLSLAVPLQIGFLWLANHDLHHLAQATVPLVLLLALAADRLAATTAPPRSVARALAAGVFVAPLLLAGVLHLRDTDAVVATVKSPSFTEAGQAALVDALRAAHVTRLVTTDYEIYGMLDTRAPEIAYTHTWGALSRGDRDPAAILGLASGGWYLSVRASAPYTYNWSPDASSVAKAADAAGLNATAVTTLSDGRSTWATLYRVEPRL
jgi:4-amino-4-deoxy-L-arabinose transferase-like glycosyltransferase